MSFNVSIYVPAFNAESAIKKCIESILSQTLKPSKILVINDCSVDNNLKILSKRDNISNNNLIIIRNE